MPLLLVILTLVLGLPSGTPPPKIVQQTAEDAAASIGVASMESDGTIVLRLRATGNGMIGEGQLRYPPTDPQYNDILKHVGPLRPGEFRPVRPWDD